MTSSKSSMANPYPPNYTNLALSGLANYQPSRGYNLIQPSYEGLPNTSEQGTDIGQITPPSSPFSTSSGNGVGQGFAYNLGVANAAPMDIGSMNPQWNKYFGMLNDQGINRVSMQPQTSSLNTNPGWYQEASAAMPFQSNPSNQNLMMGQQALNGLVKLRPQPSTQPSANNP